MKIIDATNELSHPYAAHLRVRTFSLAAGREWSPQLPGWSMIQVDGGTGYWLQGQSRMELPPGSVLVAAGEARGRILASCLSSMSLNFFTVVPDQLTGLITQGEHDYFKQAAARREFACQVLPPQNMVSVSMKELCGLNGGGLMARLNLLQLLVRVFGKGLDQTESSRKHADVKERLRLFLMETPAAALLEISFEELAKITHCTPRHLSRVFYDLVGMSFREKRAEIRLARARELLATSQSKVVDVAFTSGYKSLSLFNRMFTRRFGISPGRWRQKNGGPGNNLRQRNPKSPAGVSLMQF